MTDTAIIRPPAPRDPSEGNERVRDTEVRGAITPSVRYALWGKNAGRCTFCNHRLDGGGRTHLHSINAAELAHNIGATATKGSPRGIVNPDEDEVPDRESEENLLLLCHDCHKMIDDKAHISLYTPDKLRELKAAHEMFVELATETAGLTQTAVIRVGSDIRGSYTLASRREVMSVLVKNNYLGLINTQRNGIFTTNLPGLATDPGFWDMTAAKIRRDLALVHQALAAEETTHISVFAIAPVPVLVLLGAELDDKVETRIWQKHRGGTGWTYPSQDVPVTFAVDATDPAGHGADAEEVVLVCSLSAEVDTSKLPDQLENIPILTLRPDGVSPTPTLLEHEDSVPAFAKTFRQMLADAEKAHPRATRWHLVGAMPVAAAVEAGRAFMRDAQPPVDVYQRTDHGTYELVLTVNDLGRDISAAHLTGSRL